MPKKGSALGVARARFVEGLPRKAKELKAAMALLVATPDAERPREEMRRRMHALYASAQVFRLDPLASALKEAIARLDAARDEKRALDQDDLDSLAHLGATLPTLAGAAEPEQTSPSIAAPPPGTLRKSSRPPAPDAAVEEPAAVPKPKRPGTMIGLGVGAAPAGSEGDPAAPVAGGTAEEAPPKKKKKKKSLAKTMMGIQAARAPADGPKKSAFASTQLGVGEPGPASEAPPEEAAPAAKPDFSATSPGFAEPPESSQEGRAKKRMPFAATQPGTGPDQPTKKKRQQTMIGVGVGKPTDSARAPTPAPADDTRRPSDAGSTSSNPPAGKALGRVKLKSVPKDKARKSQPPAPAGSFTVARHGHESRPQTAGDVFRTVVSLLVVDRAAAQARIRAALPTDRFEIVAAADPEEALRLSRSVAPDIVLIDRGVAERSGADLIARLRSDPLTDLVPIALLYDGDDSLDAHELREMGADAQICRDGIEERLEARLESLTAVAGAMPSAGAFGEATLEEVADRLAKEIHRGLVDAAVEGRRLRIPLGEGSDLLAAAWATIAKVRAELAEASEGQVRFRDASGRGGPAFVSLVAEGSRAAAEDEAEPVSLEDIRIVVADDDPAVVWFFAGLFREEGAVVVEVEDGVEALEAARRKRPDLIVSDILMPRMDGLMLCRHLERDPALAEVPVILISWKEDFLQRMRELRAGASGYLRKEAASGQILQRVREVLRPRLRLESELAGIGEVRGRVEGIGVIPLLRAVARLRSDSRVTVRDAWNLYEIDIRGGELQDVTRTATDGSFARGRRALTQLLGVTAGRFSAAASDSAIRASLPGGDSDALLAAAAAELGALVDAVSGKRLARVGTLIFDEDVASAFARTSPPAQRSVVESLMSGTLPRDLLVGGEVEPHVVEEALLDLSRRGAVVAVRGLEDEDLVAEALAERGGEELAAEHGELDVPASALVMPEGDDEAALLEAPTNDPPPLFGEAKRDSLVDFSSPMKADEPADDERILEVDDDAIAAAPVVPPPKPPKRRRVVEDDDPPDEPLTLADLEAADTMPAPPSGEHVKADEAPKLEPELLSSDSMESPKAAGPEASSAGSEGAEAEAEAEGGGLGLVGWLMAIALCAVVGFFGWQAYKAQQSAGATEPEELPVEPEEPEVTPEEPEEVEPEEPASNAEAAGLGFGETVDEVLDRGVEVADGEGLLVVEAPDSGDPVEVMLRDGDDERELGEAPLSIALPEGRHRLLFRRGEREQFRYLYVGAGQSRVVDPDTM